MLSYRPVRNIGYNPPVGINVDDFEYSKFDTKERELEDNEIELPSEDEEEDGDGDGDGDEMSECHTMTDDSSSEISECEFSTIIKSRKKPQVEKIYSVVLQEEEYLPE